MPEWLIDGLADLTVPGAIALAVGLFSGSLVPFFLLVDAESLDPRVAARRGWAALVRRLACFQPLVHPVAEMWRDLAALVLLLTTSPKGAMTA
ncbi:hypothetical protein [Streptomyces sp. NPDC127072]|uniref:hypothetical protein n=1 Tax=Streptomyces sp. NPDC127072 TaxID=3347129 RepID=UPI00364E5522